MILKKRIILSAFSSVTASPFDAEREFYYTQEEEFLANTKKMKKNYKEGEKI